MGKNKNKKRLICTCKQCQFYNKKDDNCQVKNEKNCGNKDADKCDDFLIREELVMY